MKRYLILFASLLMFLANAKSQVEIKAIVGTNFSSLSSLEDGLEISAKAGYQYGLGLLIGDKFYVEPGIQFVRNSKEITVETEVETIEFAQNFVKVPVYAGYHLLGHEGGPLALRIFGGPAAYIAGKVKKGEDQIDKDDIENAHWMFDLGAGVDILFLFAEISYEHAFTDFFKDAINGNHRSFVINAGIHIDF